MTSVNTIILGFKCTILQHIVCTLHCVPTTQSPVSFVAIYLMPFALCDLPIPLVTTVLLPVSEFVFVSSSRLFICCFQFHIQPCEWNPDSELSLCNLFCSAWFSRCIHAVANRSYFILSYGWVVFPVYMFHIFFIQSSIEEHVFKKIFQRLHVWFYFQLGDRAKACRVFHCHELRSFAVTLHNSLTSRGVMNVPI